MSNFMRFKGLMLAGAVAVAGSLSGCTDDPSLIKSENPTAIPASGDGQMATVTLVDSPVMGATYNIVSALNVPVGSGTTDAAGQLQCFDAALTEEREIVTLSVGGIILDTFPCAELLLTPVELTGKATTRAAAVQNMLVFLQSIDEDMDPSNGIVIPAATTNLAADVTLDFESADFDTEVEAVVSQITGGANTVISKSQALLNFYDTYIALDLASTTTWDFPEPEPDTGGAVDPVTVYDDMPQDQWVLWDCCSEGTATIEEVAAADTSRGMVTQITYSATNTVAGFTYGDPDETAALFLGSDFAGGTLNFDVLQVAGGSGAWIVKVESEDTALNTGDVLVSSLDCGAPATGVWQSCSLPLETGSLDLDSMQVIAFFPAWDGQDGAVIQIDNVEFVPAEGAGGGGSGVDPVAVYDDMPQDQWVLWDCCSEGTATIEEVAAADTARGLVTQITYSATNTVAGFTYGDPDETAALFLGSDFAGGTLNFDVLQVTGGSGAWIVKVESEDTALNTGDVLVSSLDCGAPATGVWQSCSLPLETGSLDLDSMQVIAFFPAWDGQDGAVIQIDNVEFVPAEGAGGGGSGVDPVAVYDDMPQDQWVLWDCCSEGTATIEEVAAADTARGLVTQITYSATNTVAGFTYGDPDETAALFLGSDFAGGTLNFDVLQVTGGSGAWIVKVESEDTALNTGDVLVSSLDCGAPATGVWQSCSLPLETGSLDLDSMQVIAFFPAWDGQDGAVVQIDNVEFAPAP